MRHAANRFLASRLGATALEFALVAPLLFASVLGSFETGRVIYQQNHLSAAVAAGARSVTLNGAADETAIRNAILSKYADADRSHVAIALSQETISGKTFKKISVTYDHQLLVKYGTGFSGFTLNATRYTPAI
jgi:Flp pilus assembly protein TadG